MTKAEQNIKTTFNEEFCTQLEYRICQELENIEKPELKGYWCDGISWSVNELYLTKKYINDNRKIDTKAWIGKDGQTEFKATINFGKKALSKYSKGMDLIGCIPDIESQIEWIKIDIKNRTVEIRLN